MNKRILSICVLVVCMMMPLAAQNMQPKELVGTDTVHNKKFESGFTWSASAVLTSNYIWRGLYVGGSSLQVDATIDYKGLFANVWWNIGSRDWTFTGLNPEVDIAIGYSRWGLSVYYIHMYYFDRYANGTRSKFFDFRNHEQGGTTGEWRVAYQRPLYTSKQGLRTNLSLLGAIRTFGRDGFVDDKGELKRAYSSYLEVGVDQTMGKYWNLSARVGMTPHKSLYTGYKGKFAVTLVGLRITKQWKLSHGALSAFAHVMLQPWKVTKENLILPIEQAGNQKLNMAVGCSYGI